MNLNGGTVDRVLRVLAGLVLIARAATGPVGWWGCTVPPYMSCTRKSPAAGCLRMAWR